ncbi:hypothetical protein VUR80DRAFT_1901 [Thermomyces stellatus]
MAAWMDRDGSRSRQTPPRGLNDCIDGVQSAPALRRTSADSRGWREKERCGCECLRCPTPALFTVGDSAGGADGRASFSTASATELGPLALGGHQRLRSEILAPPRRIASIVYRSCPPSKIRTGRCQRRFDLPSYRPDCRCSRLRFEHRPHSRSSPARAADSQRREPWFWVLSKADQGNPGNNWQGQGLEQGMSRGVPVGAYRQGPPLPTTLRPPPSMCYSGEGGTAFVSRFQDLPLVRVGELETKGLVRWRNTTQLRVRPAPKP